jgi:alanyl aminopeptidase
VGDFDVTPIDGLDIPGVIYSPKGTGGATGFAVQHTPAILAALEAYFGSDYPYEKIDFVAVPNFTFGAMENVGLVTYRSELLLRGDNPAPAAALSTVNVIAHELAHMWYGNLVTMAWWDDLWLNEAFASWMANKVTVGLFPQYQADLSLPQSNAFSTDALGATKPIRKEVKTEEDVLDGLGLNYSKGHSILNMLEQSIGEDNFRAAIRDYMGKHQWGNTVASDLWGALSRQAEYEVGAVAATFLNQPGFPLISIDADGIVRQQRFENKGAGLSAQRWEVPVSMKLKTEAGIESLTVTLKDNAMKVPELADAEWVLPASNGNGYYVWQTAPAQYEALLADINQLSDREKAALLTNGGQLLNADAVDLAQHTSLLAAMAEQRNEEIVLQAVEGLRAVAGMYVGTDLEAPVAELISERLTPWYLKLRLAPSESDSDSALKLRPRVLRTLAEYGDNPEINSAMSALATNYLENPDKVDAGVGFEALRVNALNNGNLEIAETYLETYASTDNATLKAQLSSAMYFRDPAAVNKVLDSLAKGGIVSGDIVSVMQGLSYANRYDQSQLYVSLATHYDTILGLVPEFRRPVMPQVVGAGCSATNLELQREFFEPQGELFATSLSKAQESAGNCVGRAQRGREALKSYLEGN